jgi:hypothetical protein
MWKSEGIFWWYGQRTGTEDDGVDYRLASGAREFKSQRCLRPGIRNRVHASRNVWCAGWTARSCITRNNQGAKEVNLGIWVT